MSDLIAAALAELQLGDVGRALWEPVVSHLTLAPDARDEAPFLDAVGETARGAGLSQGVPLAALLEAYAEGSNGLYAALVAVGTHEAHRPPSGWRLSSVRLSSASPAATPKASRRPSPTCTARPTRRRR